MEKFSKHRGIFDYIILLVVIIIFIKRYADREDFGVIIVMLYLYLRYRKIN